MTTFHSNKIFKSIWIIDQTMYIYILEMKNPISNTPKLGIWFSDSIYLYRICAKVMHSRTDYFTIFFLATPSCIPWTIHKFFLKISFSLFFFCISRYKGKGSSSSPIRNSFRVLLQFIFYNQNNTRKSIFFHEK